MKLFTVKSFLAIGLLSAVTYAGDIPEGKYVFSSPALFGSAKGEARGKVCDLEATEKGYQLTFLNNPLSRGSRITFSVTNGRIVFDESHMPSSEIGRTIIGEGNLQSDAIATGKLTVSMGSVGFLLAKRKSSEWCLRPATKSEVLSNYAEGLKKAEELLWSNRAIERPTRENAITALYSVVGYGFTRKDVPELEKMLESGDLNYKDGKLFFRQISLNNNLSPGLPISTNVVVEIIDLREKIAAITNEPMQVVEATDKVASNFAPLVVYTPESTEPVPKEALKQIDVEPIPEPQESWETPTAFPVGWIAFGAGSLVLLAIVAIICRKKMR
jgi:hypothetical protein